MSQIVLFILMITMLAVATWIVVSIFSSRVSEPNYERIAICKGYEIRKYDPFIEAVTEVDGPYSIALSEGFRRIGGYIFGNNKQKQSIRMTAPVLNTHISDKKRRVAFVMPEGSKLKAMPIPEDGRVELINRPTHIVAVIRFRGPINALRITQQEEKLLDLMKRDDIRPTSKPQSARYNPPWTFPLIARNEIHIECDYKTT